MNILYFGKFISTKRMRKNETAILNKYNKQITSNSIMFSIIIGRSSLLFLYFYNYYYFTCTW